MGGDSSTGSTFDSINGSDLKKAVFTVPSESKEQSAIAEILTDMDAEIDALTAKLNKARLIKQGMMQQLLTGRIRLVDDETYTLPKEKPIPKVIELPKVETKGHNQQFDDAVVISAIVNAFYNPKYALGRVKIQKLLYLYRRHQDETITEFQKKAAGPYDEQVRYKGGEPIALRNGYIEQKRNTRHDVRHWKEYRQGNELCHRLGHCRRYKVACKKFPLFNSRRS